MKALRVTTILVLPPPTVYSVPLAQPPPSCMPIPNRKAPKATETPAGATKPPTGRPSTLPASRTGKIRTVAIASITIWARRPLPSPVRTNCRQAAVKPKAAWYSARPRPPATAISAARRHPKA